MKKTVLQFLQLSVFIFIGACNNHQKTDVDDLSSQKTHFKMDSLLALDEFKQFNGNILVLDSGKIKYQKCLGYLNFDTKEFLNDSSLFELASCSKQFTGMAIMILAEQGKLNYSDDIQKYIPDLPYSHITIEQLLTHSSGIPEYGPLMQSHWNTNVVASNYDIVNVLKKIKPKLNHNPDESYEYSNTGYILLSIIIEKASGMSYPEFLDKNIFKVLGMKHSFVCCACKPGETKNLACGYTYAEKTGRYILASENSFLNSAWLQGVTGDGSIQSNMPDLALWDDALRNNKLVKKTTLDKAFSAHILKNGQETNYGFGQAIVRGDKNGKAVYHGGGWPGYRTGILHFIDNETTIIVLSNNEFPNLNKLIGKIRLIYLGK